MSILQSIILGILQGLTEFLPVSSTAHLLIAQNILGLTSPIDEQAKFLFIFDILVQLGTLLALIIYFWKDWVAIIGGLYRGVKTRQPFTDPQARLGWYILLASLPALVAGVLLKPLVEQLFRTPLIEAAIRLTLTTILLLGAEWLGKRSRNMSEINWKDALWIGCAQILSIFPGASRSGSTLAGGMARNLDRPAAARFAFLMSVPVMLAAGAYQSLGLLKIPHLATYLPPILVSIIVATIVGYLAIHWLLDFLAHRPLYVFSIYCAIVGLITLIRL